MFDIGFWELCVIAVIGLLVLGPERLPRVARVAGGYLRKARATWASVRSEISRELAAEDLKKAMSEPVEDLRSAMREPAAELDRLRRESRQTIDETGATADASAGESAPQAPEPGAAKAPGEPPDPASRP